MDEIDKMSIFLQYIWNGNEYNENRLHCFKLFRMKISNTVHYFGN